MAQTPQLYLQILPEYYGQLTLDELVTALVTNQGNLLQPPFQQPALDLSQGQTNTSTTAAFAQQTSAAKLSKPWLQWLWAVYRLITAGAAEQTIEIVAPSVDETDDAWWAAATAIVSATDDPLTVSVTLAGVTRFGPQTTITSSGSGYSGTVTVSVASSNGQGQAAKGTAVLSAGGIVGWVQTTQGYNLVSPLVVTFGSGAATATATLGRQFAVGDYVIWNDPTIVSSAYSYEIDQITSITPTDDTHFTCTLARSTNPSSSAGPAQFGSLKNAHASGANFFRLIPKTWFVGIDVAAGPQVLNLLWPNMTVAAVLVGQGGQSSGTITVNLAPLPYLAGTSTPNPRLTPPSPGMRTMNGAAYCSLGASGNLTIGTTAAVRVPVQAWESLRTIYALVRTAPVGATTFNGDADAAIVIYVCYISTGGLVGLVDTLVIDTGDLSSYNSTNPPDGRQMPYHADWTGITPNADWPPNLLPQLTGALDANGNLQLGFSISTSAFVTFAPDGVLDFIVSQVGTSTAGANLTLAVQT